MAITNFSRLAQMRDTKANIEALGAGTFEEAAYAFATDTEELGIYTGGAWFWISGGQYRALVYSANTHYPVKEARIFAVNSSLGASAPNEARRAVGASGGVELPILEFSQTVDQETFFTFHAPVEMLVGSHVHFEFMWAPGPGWSAGNYVWKLEYLIFDEEGGDLTAGAPTTIDMDVTPANATDAIETSFPDDINLQPEQFLVGRFYRDVSEDNGDDTGDVFVFEIAYTIPWEFVTADGEPVTVLQDLE